MVLVLGVCSDIVIQKSSLTCKWQKQINSSILRQSLVFKRSLNDFLALSLRLFVLDLCAFMARLGSCLDANVKGLVNQ